MPAKQNRKILVVDNNPVFLGLMKSFLKKNGHQVWTADNSLAALDALKTNAPDFIFIDYIMPDIDGGKLCRKIREIQAIRKPTIILVSAIAAEQDIDYISLGFDACIAKGPFDLMTPKMVQLLQRPHRKTHGVDREGIYPREITKELLVIKHRLETTLSSISEAVLEVTDSGRILYVNPAATDIIGKTELELLACDFQTFFKKGTQKKIKRKFSQCDMNPFSPECDFELWNERKVTINISPVEEDSTKKILVIRDITEKRLAETELNFHRQFEKLVTDVSTRFISMPSDKIEKGIKAALKKIGCFAGVDCCYIAQFSEAACAFTNIYQWSQHSAGLRFNPSDTAFRWYSEQLKQLNIIHIPDLDMLPQKAKSERSVLEKAGVQSLLHIPIASDNIIMGIIGLEIYSGKRLWSEEMISLMRIVGEIFFNAIKRAGSDKALRASERKYRELADLLPQVVFEADTEGTLTFVNRQAQDYFGKILLQDQKVSMFDMILPEERQIARENYRRVLKNNDPSPRQYSLRKSDGSIATMIINTNAIHHHGETVGVRGVASDITERKRWEDLYRTLADKSFAGVYLLVEGRYKYVNAKFAEFVGYDSEELINQKSINLVHPEDRKATWENAIAMLKGQRTAPYEFRILMKSGTIRWAMETVSSVFYDGKRAILGNVMDLTERKTAEEQLLYLSTHDSLTNLYNRAYFEAEVKRLEQGRRFPVNVLIADIDFLKETNDTLGHWAGDDLLRRTASVIRQVFRHEDVVARIGGDEFAAIWTDSGQLSAETVLYRIKRSLSNHNKAYHDAPLSLSIGIASGPRGCSVGTLMREADKRMYEEKAKTRHSVGTQQIRRVK